MHSAGNEGRPRRPPLLQGFPSPRSARMRRTRFSAPHLQKMRHRAREQAAPGPGEGPASNREGPENNARASPAHPFRGGGGRGASGHARQSAAILAQSNHQPAPPAFAPLPLPPAMAFARGELDNTFDLRNVDVEDDCQLDERDVGLQDEDPDGEAFFDCKEELFPPPAAAGAPESPSELAEHDERRYDVHHHPEKAEVAGEPQLAEHAVPEAAGLGGIEPLLGLGADDWLLAQPGAGPPRRHGGFQPEDIWTGEMAFVADALRDKFWRGTVFLARREQVESSEWWGRNRIGLAVSANAGPFGEPIEGRRWFSYPPGCLSMNVPITAAFTDAVQEQLMNAFIMMVAVLAAGWGVAVHCLHSKHRGPLLLMWFLAVLEKNLFRGAMDDEENVARRSAAIMGRLKSIWPAVCNVHVTVPRSSDPLWARRLLLYRDAVEQAAHVPSAFAGAVRTCQLSGGERLGVSSHWWLLLDVVREVLPAQPRQDAFRELAGDLTRELVCGLPPAVYSDYVADRRGGNAGRQSKRTGSASKGSASKCKGKGKSTKGYGSGATAAGAPAAAGERADALRAAAAAAAATATAARRAAVATPPSEPPRAGLIIV